MVIEFWKAKKEIHTIDETFYEWAKEKLKYGEIEKNTYDRYETDFIRSFSEVKDVNIKVVTEDFLEDFIKSTIHDRQLTSKAYAGMRTLLIGIFKYAKKHKYSDISSSTFLEDLGLSKRIFTKKPRCKEKEVFTHAEIKAIIAYIDMHAHLIREQGVALAIHTGLRPGELTALKASDIDLENRTIHVQRSEVKYKGENGENIIGVKEYPKSEAGERYLLLSDMALERARILLAMNPDGEYLFQGKYSPKRISENGFNHKLRCICQALDIPVRTMHKLRKTYCTELIDRGVDKSTITEQMGHADIKTTLEYYYFGNKGTAEKLEQLNQVYAD